MIDALCHLELFASPGDALRALEAAAKKGLTDVVSAGTDPRAPERVPPSSAVRVHRAFGVHPENADVAPADKLLAALDKRLAEPGVVAVGECGLDGRDGTPDLDLQRALFEAQLAMARRRGLPAIVHGVRAPVALLDVVRESGARFVWHAFGESKDTARQALDLGGVLSVGALVLNPRARKLHEALAALDVDVLLETDAPEVDPVALADIAAAVARARKRPVDDVIAGSRRLAIEVYGLAEPPST